MSSEPRILSVTLQAGCIVVVEAILPDNHPDVSRHHLDPVLGSSDGRFSPDGENFSHSARKIRLTDLVLKAELATIDGRWLEDEIRLTIELPDATSGGVRVILPENGRSCPLLDPSELQTLVEARRQSWGLLLKGRLLLLVLALPNSPQSAFPCVDLNECIGVEDGEFSLVKSDLLDSARNLNFSGTTLYAELLMDNGDWKRRQLDAKGLVQSRLALRDPRFRTFEAHVWLETASDDRDTLSSIEPSVSQVPLYSLLNRGRNAIRLCIILPGEWHEPMRCELKVQDDGCVQAYRCLSYAWGDPTRTQEITVNGHPFQATTNLFSALRTLRRRGEGIPIWIDALCINQQDLDEKGWQVGRMGEIYLGAECVVVWLSGGPFHLPSDTPSADVESVLFCLEGSLRHLVSGQHVADIPGLFVRDANGTSPGDQFSTIICGLMTLHESPWWHRTWTYQEIILARSAIILFEHIELGLQTLTFAAMTILFHRGNCGVCSRAYSQVDSTTRYALRAWADPLAHISGSRPAYQDLHRDRIDTAENKSVEKDQDRLRQAWDLAYRGMSDTGLRNATDPRDKVFGMLALIPSDGDSSFVPDYSLSTEEIYRKFVLFVVKASRSFGIWDMICSVEQSAGDSAADILHLPSWVIDWRSKDTGTVATSVLCSKVFQFAVAPSPSDSLMSIDDSLLVVEGVQVATVSRTSDLSWPVDDLADETNRAVALRHWRDLIFRDSDQGYPSGGTLKDAFWRTLICDHFHVDMEGVGSGLATFRRAQPQDADAFEKWAELTEADRPYDTLPDIEEQLSMVSENRISHVIKSWTAGKKIFKTSEGYIGIGHASVRDGDVLYTLKSGTKWHYILRPTSSHPSHSEGVPVYGLVGPAYVHGMMDGENHDSLNEPKILCLC